MPTTAVPTMPGVQPTSWQAQPPAGVAPAGATTPAAGPYAYPPQGVPYQQPVTTYPPQGVAYPPQVGAYPPQGVPYQQPVPQLLQPAAVPGAPPAAPGRGYMMAPPAAPTGTTNPPAGQAKEGRQWNVFGR
jgi:hypothetical protein